MIRLRIRNTKSIFSELLDLCSFKTENGKAEEVVVHFMQSDERTNLILCRGRQNLGHVQIRVIMCLEKCKGEELAKYKGII